MSPRSMDFRHCPRCAETTLHASLRCTRTGCNNSLMPAWQPIPKDSRDYDTERRVGEKPKVARDIQRQQSARNSMRLTPKERAAAEHLALGHTYAETAVAIGAAKGSIASLLFRASCRLGTDTARDVVEIVRKEMRARLTTNLTTDAKTLDIQA